MDSSKEIESILRKIYETLEKSYPEGKEIDYETYLDKSGLINLLNNQHGNLILLVDVKRLKIIHVSGSVFDYTGYRIEEFGNNIPLNFMKLFDPKYLSFLKKVIWFMLSTVKSLPIANKKKQYISTWGLKLFHKSGREMR